MQIALTHKGQAALWVTNGCTSMSNPITTKSTPMGVDKNGYQWLRYKATRGWSKGIMKLQEAKKVTQSLLLLYNKLIFNYGGIGYDLFIREYQY